MHFTPTSASWMNMVERFFRDITVNRLRRGVFTNVPELATAADVYEGRMKHCTGSSGSNRPLRPSARGLQLALENNADRACRTGASHGALVKAQRIGNAHTGPVSTEWYECCALGL
jgi:hypothetical protein